MRFGQPVLFRGVAALALFLACGLSAIAEAPCTGNLLANGDFESDSLDWTELAPDGFSIVTAVPGAHSGGRAAWFGGADLLAVWTIGQSVVIPEDYNARLVFYLKISTPVAGDYLAVFVDGQEYYRATDTTEGFVDWNAVTIDLSGKTDGGEHSIEFSGFLSGNFYVDDVCITTSPATCDTFIDFDGIVAPEGFLLASVLRDEFAGQGVRFDGGGALLSSQSFFNARGFSAPTVLAFNRLATLIDNLSLAAPPGRITFDSPVQELRLRMGVPGLHGTTDDLSLFAYNVLDEVLDSAFVFSADTNMYDFVLTGSDIKYVVLDTSGDALIVDDICIGGNPAAVPGCSIGTLYGQPAREVLADEVVLNVSATGAAQTLLERFVDAGEPVQNLRWWGSWVELGTGVPCTPSFETFQIFTYVDNGGVPGSAYSGIGAVINSIPTGRVLPSGALEREFSYKLPIPFPFANGWISFSSSADPTCVFAWESSDAGDASFYKRNDSTSALEVQAGNLAFCVAPGTGPLQFCAFGGGSVYGQLPEAPEEEPAPTASSEFSTQAVFEKFTISATDNLKAVRWWGIEAETGPLPCDRGAGVFDVSFYSDDGGFPGALLGTTTVTPTRVATGRFFVSSSEYDEYRYEANITPIEGIVNGWISIRSTGDTDCGFLWGSAALADGYTVSRLNGGPDQVVSEDMAFCLSTVAIAEGEGEGEGAETGVQTADQDANFVVSLSELLRVIQFYNSLGLHCADVPSSTEDGFVPGPGANQTCTPYDTDYAPQNWVISLSELLRVIQFYNSGAYNYCPLAGTEDDFCPGIV